MISSWLMTINIITYTYINFSQLLLNLLCFCLDCANCYNKERVSLQFETTTQPTRRYLYKYNIARIMFQIHVLYQQETCIYSIFN